MCYPFLTPHFLHYCLLLCLDDFCSKMFKFLSNFLSFTFLVSIQFSHSVVSDSLRPHEPQHARPPCPSPTAGVQPNPCPLSRSCHPTISSSVIALSPHCQSFSIRVFSHESVLHIRWPKYLSFSLSISPSNEYSGLISLRVDWFDLLAVQATLKSLLQHHSLKASILSIAFNSKQSTCYSSTFGDGIFCSPLNLFHKPSQ